jgi:hypothetical protein
LLIFNPRTTGLPYTSFRIARKGFEGIGKVVFPHGEFSTLTTRGDMGRVSFPGKPVTLGASLSKAVVFEHETLSRSAYAITCVLDAEHLAD